MSWLLVIGGALCVLSGVLYPPPFSWRALVSVLAYTAGLMLIVDGLKVAS